MKTLPELVIFSNEVRKKCIALARKSGTGHIGSALSIVEMLVAIYQRYDPLSRGSDGGRNRFVLSKGHGALSLIALLMLKGVIDEDQNARIQS